MQISNRLELMEHVKENIINKTYDSGVILKKDLDEIVDSFWYKDGMLKNEDLYHIDLKDFSIFHDYLIKKVIAIHEGEISNENAEILKKGTCFNISLEEINDAKSAYKIYTFNESYEYVFIGDLHSDDQSLKRALQSIEFYEKVVSNQKIRLVFTGDYVDRGHVHLKLMERVLLLKYLFPEYIFLLRGNHDGGILEGNGSLILPYRIPEEDTKEMYFPHYLKTLGLKNKSFKSTLLERYLNLFNSLSYIAAIKNGSQIVLAVHGGIPRPKYENSKFYKHLNVLSDLTDQSIVDHMGINICQNIMWSDPHKGDKDLREQSGRFQFTKEHFNEFKERFGFDILIRGHESAADGFRYHFDECLITVFSTGGMYESNDKLGDKEELNSESGYLEINPKVLSISYDGMLTFL
ncbi:metallophosphoesterase family protein [Vallitalea okinawensis]|uniref:metallophosphoesterase family protein n=1 Tax=Vallitalea okinawensis TaxID=2078660 RepID=UPI0013002DEC|nr:metallophosphoesterase family protein [Vallitalea okinawensis]